MNESASVNRNPKYQPILMAWLLTVLSGSTLYATEALVNNTGTTNDAQIDAVVFINSGQFSISSLRAYSTLNTLAVTNTQSGKMFFSSGVTFEHIPTGAANSSMLDSFANFGEISSLGIAKLKVRAKELISIGRMSAPDGGGIHLEGQNINMERGSFTARPEPTSFTDRIESRPTNYLNLQGIEDIYWGSGLGGRDAAQGGGGNPFAISLTQNPFPIPSPLANVETPFHEILQPSSGIPNVTPNLFIQSSYASYMWTNLIGTNHIIQVVLVNTNTLTANIGVDVRFLLNSDDVNVRVPMIRFSLTASNFITAALETKQLYFVDTSAIQTNATLAMGTDGVDRRPRAFKISRGNALDSDFTNSFFAQLSNTVQQFDTFYPAGLNFTNQFVTNYRYWAYGAQIGSPRINRLVNPFNPNPNRSIGDATNKVGRIEVYGDNVNLRLARLQAENTIIITTTNLISTEGARFEAPNLVINVARENGTILLDDFVPEAITNFNGFMQAYSATWTNRASNGESYMYHVLMLNAALVEESTPVQIPTLNVRAANIVVKNKLNAAKSFIFDAAGLLFDTGTELRLDAATIPNFLPANFPNLQNFTNRGVVTVPGTADIVGGVNTANTNFNVRLTNYINNGLFLARIINIECDNFESSGTNAAFDFQSDSIPTTFELLSTQTGGQLAILATAVKLRADTAAGKRGRQLAVGDITIRGKTLKLIGQDIMTPARFILDMTDLVTDGLNITNPVIDADGAVSNTITVGRGFSVLCKPSSGDLLGTSIETVIPRDFTIEHYWAANNLGKSLAGYTNNLALGKLIINTKTNLGQPYLVKFAGTGTSNAMYVDLLDLRGSITNGDLSTHLEIASNLTIYFANAFPSVEYLLGAITNASNTNLRHRIQWVSDFTGLNSSQLFSITTGSGDVVPIVVNSAKFNSQFLDSDGDGVVNGAEDALNSGTPFDGVEVLFDVGYMTNNLGEILSTVTWRAASETSYRIEARATFTNQWIFLTNVFNGSLVNGNFTYTNQIPAGTDTRYYRIGYQP